jgi:hypothetical protein
MTSSSHSTNEVQRHDLFQKRRQLMANWAFFIENAADQ